MPPRPAAILRPAVAAPAVAPATAAVPANTCCCVCAVAAGGGAAASGGGLAAAAREWYAVPVGSIATDERVWNALLFLGPLPVAGSGTALSRLLPPPPQPCMLQLLLGDGRSSSSSSAGAGFGGGSSTVYVESIRAAARHYASTVRRLNPSQQDAVVRAAVALAARSPANAIANVEDAGSGSGSSSCGSSGGGGGRAELQLVQGPPGTGKTSTTAAQLSVLAAVGRPGTALLATAPTNAAVGETASRCVCVCACVCVHACVCVCVCLPLSVRMRIVTCAMWDVASASRPFLLTVATPHRYISACTYACATLQVCEAGGGGRSAVCGQRGCGGAAPPRSARGAAAPTRCVCAARGHGHRGACGGQAGGAHGWMLCLPARNLYVHLYLHPPSNQFNIAFTTCGSLSSRRLATCGCPTER